VYGCQTGTKGPIPHVKRTKCILIVLVMDCGWRGERGMRGAQCIGSLCLTILLLDRGRVSVTWGCNGPLV
jgi:hypothetical protein